VCITVHSLDLTTDRDRIIGYLRDNLPAASDPARFDWLYLRNPWGQARAWSVSDDSAGEIVGVGAAFPRWIWAGENRRRAWILGDFAVSPQFRSLGPALLLQRTCLSSITHGADTLCVDFPSKGMLAVYRRLGIAPAGRLVRYIKLLKVDSRVRKLIPVEMVAHGIAGFVNRGLRLRDLARPTSSYMQLWLHEGEFGEEFTTLDSETVCGNRVRATRTAEYLNWRYRQNPLRQYWTVTARRDAGLQGYVTFEDKGTEWVIADCGAQHEDAVVPAILTYIIHLAQRMGIETLCATAIENSSLSRHLRRAGFWARESSSFVAYSDTKHSALTARKDFVLLEGDRES
jgi:GNAT superfamily N-acetyltransferase